MFKKILLISEVISFPFDEGLKNIIYQLIKNFSVIGNILIVTKKGNNTDGLDVTKIKLNKLFLNNELRSLLESYSPNVILYIPEASCTFNSFIRAKILKLINRKSKVVMLAIQHREYSFLFRTLLHFVRPDLLILLGKADKLFFEKKQIKVKVLPPAVDNERFHKVGIETKTFLRKKYGIPTNKTIVSHVGHIKISRNIKCLIDVQKMDNIQVIIVGSTSTHADSDLKNLLENQGIIVINSYLPDIQEIYQISDIYVFPVLEKYAAIEMPLSILEAMACNLPVITTRFGALVEYFKEEAGFRYFNTTEELIELINNIEKFEVNNDNKIKDFTWNKFVNETISTCRNLI